MIDVSPATTAATAAATAATVAATANAPASTSGFMRHLFSWKTMLIFSLAIFAGTIWKYRERVRQYFREKRGLPSSAKPLPSSDHASHRISLCKPKHGDASTQDPKENQATTPLTSTVTLDEDDSDDDEHQNEEIDEIAENNQDGGTNVEDKEINEDAEDQMQQLFFGTDNPLSNAFGEETSGALPFITQFVTYTDNDSQRVLMNPATQGRIQEIDANVDAANAGNAFEAAPSPIDHAESGRNDSDAPVDINQEPLQSSLATLPDETSLLEDRTQQLKKRRRRH